MSPELKTIVIGSNSFLGRRFYDYYKTVYPETLGTDYKKRNAEIQLDLVKPDLQKISFKRGEWDWALISAGIPNTALCEKDPAYTHEVNVKGLFAIVERLVEREITPIVFSTNYVFDGEVGGYSESSFPSPLNEYGRQKVELESLILKNFEKEALVLRCDKIFGVNPGDKSLVDQITEALGAKKAIKAAVDLFFAPIFDQDLIEVVVRLQKRNSRGLFHVSGPEVMSRYEFTKKVASFFDFDSELIQPISLDELEISYKLPKKPTMISDKLRDEIDFSFTPILDCLKRLLV